MNEFGLDLTDRATRLETLPRPGAEWSDLAGLCAELLHQPGQRLPP